MRTCPPSAPAETIRPVSTLCGCSLRRAGARFRTLHCLPLAVYVRAVVGAVRLWLLRSIVSSRGRAVLRLWSWLRLCREQLRKQNEPEKYDRECPLHSSSIGEVRPVYISAPSAPEHRGDQDSFNLISHFGLWIFRASAARLLVNKGER